MIKSMTGFGRASSDEDSARSFSLEMKSVNHRYLDINIRMPKSMIPLEEKIRRIVGERLNRGKVDIFLNYKNYGQFDTVAKLNTELADSYVNCLKQIKDRYSLKDELSLNLISKFPDVIVLEEQEENLEEIWNELMPLVNRALDTIIDMRETEGQKLYEDIIIKSKDIEENVKKIEKKCPEVLKAYKEKLKEKLQGILENIELDENRLAMEVAIFADKSTIDEEITRLYSHINQLRGTLLLKEPIGRRLDFIVQEMNREANTIASKSTDLEITNLVINIKNMIEKIREQIQNIE
ncbi:YicC/YloC family endoribonuclease [Clostridium manihotivorum]|uniref:YicC family protein n=1 Tax=Clostridium manihotivorum TaxID=2320868 RepID=A0A410DW57_9CLOT|nr:YicC/YloC family endoribonuclease [Clostridium manihotivorum]QAA33271.1 YicC family protein [Clostridium manihotivorum]